MPLTVRAWPDSTDPRGSHFSLLGYSFGQVPPNKFLLTTTGALEPYDQFNTGVLIVATDDTPPTTTYDDGGFDTILLKTGQPEPIGVPIPWTVRLLLAIQVPPEPLYLGQIDLAFPAAIRTYSIPMVSTGGPPNHLPNPILLTPENHLFEL